MKRRSVIKSPKREMAILLSCAFLPIVLNAATVWTGPRISFTKAALADPHNAANQDRITPNVWITRDATQGIFNAKKENGYTHVSSPADTEWATGTTAERASLDFVEWEIWAGGANKVPTIVGRDAVVHLISEDIYIDIRFTSWGAGSTAGGGFSYSRSTAATAANSPPTVSITSPANNSVLVAGTTATITATAADSDGTVAQVEFFANGSSLGIDTTSPYSVQIPKVPAGSYALTAKATDNSGASTTSTAVNVTVQTLAPLRITKSTAQGGSLAIEWTGGTAPYVVQKKTNVAGSTWTNVTTISQTSVVVPRDADQAFFRIGGSSQ